MFNPDGDPLNDQERGEEQIVQPIFEEPNKPENQPIPEKISNIKYDNYQYDIQRKKIWRKRN